MGIPKVIHYCWFGGAEKSALIKKCIKSWKRKCPDYQIIEWNESNFDCSCNEYCQMAYQEKRWAFLSDYARLKILYDHGGIYMDTDVELLKPLDSFLDAKCFMGFQHENYISNGLITGAEKGHWFIREHMEIYEQMQFKGGKRNGKFMICQEYTTSLLKEKGLSIPYKGDGIQHIRDIVLYPPDYFCPYDIRTNQMIKTRNTVAIHHFSSSWWDDSWKSEHKERMFIQNADRIIHSPNRLLRNLVGLDNYERIKRKLKKR